VRLVRQGSAAEGPVGAEEAPEEHPVAGVRVVEDQPAGVRLHQDPVREGAVPEPVGQVGHQVPCLGRRQAHGPGRIGGAEAGVDLADHPLAQGVQARQRPVGRAERRVHHQAV
jgi:hypothetical protein